MTWAVFLLVAIGLLLALLFAGVRIFAAFLALNLVGLTLLLGPRGFGLFSNSIYETATSPSLMTVALFVLMGEVLFRSGTVAVLFDSIDRLVGGLRGRLYVVTIALSTVFGALSGSAVAVAAMLGRSVLPLMQARGYDTRLSAGTILAGASLAPIIPPSLLAIIVGSLADVSIAGLLVAGILPGILFAGLTLAWVIVSGDSGVERQSADAVGRIASPSAAGLSVPLAIARMLPFLIVVFSVMGLILLGIATPSEAAATGVVGAIVVAALFGRLSLRMLGEAVSSAVTIAGVILVIVCSAKLFSQLLSLAGATRGLVALTGELGLGPDLTLLLMMLIPFFLCMFIDQIAFMLLAVPIYQPIVASMGYDPIWFWTLFLIILTVGSLTPPFGYTLFALRGANPTLSTARVFSAAWPVVGIFLSGMVILWALPGLVTAIPALLK
ncbi:TRAP transporter large permease [Stappia sp. ES.058]|uniref:TRAP transporter large permease n=1 Tax=Stappia sp. ES.058 TaxID=1881061 RepID=UPI00087C9E6E|nr:TRAP transporter large permease [Stappia sp. ES.058]SDU15504.1 TRAP transporter, DctM subunit [Stappia sp. ES.058]